MTKHYFPFYPYKIDTYRRLSRLLLLKTAVYSKCLEQKEMITVCEQKLLNCLRSGVRASM